MPEQEKDRTWAEVVSGDFVLSARTGRWYEVLTVADIGGGMVKWAPRSDVPTLGKKAISFTVPADGAVRVRRSEMGAAVDIFVGIMSSGPNGYRDASTDQMDPFISRVRGLRNKLSPPAGQGAPVPWGYAKQLVLDELHEQALAVDDA